MFLSSTTKCYWKDALLTLSAMLALFFLFSPETFLFYLHYIFLFVVIIATILLWVMHSLKKCTSNLTKNTNTKNTPLFLNDCAINASSSDKLDIKGDALKFAEDVLNNNSLDPIVFGLDSPWGSGKSSYLNFCKNAWKDKNNIIIFEFKPVLYDTKKQDIIVSFIDDLLKTLKIAGIDTSSLKIAFRKYLVSIKKFSILGINIDISNFLKDSNEKTLEKIKTSVANLDEKIIIIIDDLDRLYLEDIKAILGIVRNVLYINNITFVLCYDTSNINTFEAIHKTVHSTSYNYQNDNSEKKEGALYQYSRANHKLDNQKINDYFEKIVQVKKMLIPNKHQLEKFFISEIQKINITNLNIPSSHVKYFFKSKNYPRYHALVGDIRKIKRIINFFKTLKASKTDFTKWDIHFTYLVQFILLYINYPHIFRKIYTEETGGGREFFSVAYNYDPNHTGSHFNNSIKFSRYLQTISEEECFLLEELFSIKNRETDMNDSEFQRYSPMFNGGIIGRNNLEDYLKIIVDQKSSSRCLYDNYHFSKIKKIRSMSVTDIFNKYKLCYGVNKDATYRMRFFEALKKTTDLDYKSSNKAINHIVKNLPMYSSTDCFSEIYDGTRKNLLYDILIFLDRHGWDENDKHKDNYFNVPDEDLKIIPKRLFGNITSFMQKGIFADLLDEERGILGFIDAIKLLTFCSRGTLNELNYIFTALDIYEKNNQIDIQRKGTQEIFKLLNSRYILNKKNIFKEINNLPKNALLGEYVEFIEKQCKKKSKNINNELAKIKSGKLNYLLYYFGKSDKNTGGNYNEEGDRDENGISQKIQNYLFSTCFNMEVDKDNYIYFIDYLLQNFQNLPTDNKGYVPDLDSFKKILDEDKLKNYWKENNKLIKRYMQKLSPETKIITYNYTITYKDALDLLFEELDKLLKKNNKKK